MLIIAAGMTRAGSTVQYQIVCELIESLGLGMTIGWVDLLTKEFLENLENVLSIKDKFLIIKSHQYSPPVETLIKIGKAKVIYVYRDLRDVSLSLTKTFVNSFDEAISWSNNQLENYYLWTAIDEIMVSRYENMVADLYNEVLRIANYLEIKVTNSLAREIASKFELNRQKQRIKEFDYEHDGLKGSGEDMYDPVSQLHKNHINSGKWGQWKKSLSKEQIKLIESLAFSWFVDREYPLSTFQKDDGKTAILHFKQARKFKQDGKLSEATNSYRQAIICSPDSSLYHYNLGEVLLKLGKTDHAINAYYHAIYLNPASALSHQGLGRALSQAGQLNQAVEHYRQAVKIRPNTPRFENSLNQGLAASKN